MLAAATSLPEIFTGLQSVHLGDDQLAISDIFGGNAILPVLFLLATLLSGEAVLPQAHAADIYLTGVGLLLTSRDLLFRPGRRVLGMGTDSLTVLLFYVISRAACSPSPPSNPPRSVRSADWSGQPRTTPSRLASTPS